MADTSHTIFLPAVQPGPGDASEELLRSEQVLEPGYYWRAKRDVGDRIPAGDVLLLVELVEFEDRLHSVKVRCHPRDGEGEYKFLIADFVADFEPADDGDAVRAEEQQGILNRVAELQDELVRTQGNPHLMLEAVKPLIEADEDARKNKQARDEEKQLCEQESRRRNLSKLHRRAARRSAAKGNPLTLPKVAVGTNISQLLAAGVDEGGVVQLREMAERQMVLAQAQANWLTDRTEQITRTLKQLAPYAAEKAAVALARSSDAVRRAHLIRQGIESLDLYTGKGVDVFEVRDGAEAPAHVPLTLVQGKRYMEEELAAHVDTSVDFDWRSQAAFFEELATNEGLLNQVFPTERCVVSMCVTRHLRQYGNAWQDLLNNLQNQLVFLLVRNGGKVHVVYSATPSHEAADRLFPTQDELGEVFRGADGTKVSLRDVEFGEKSKRFDDLSLHYRRFLILLCGLDHRLRLMGEFYPPEQQINFMSADFQARYMRFYADEEFADLLPDGGELPSVRTWMHDKNAMVQSGSRVFLISSVGAARSSPELGRRRGLAFVEGQFKREHIAAAEGSRCFVTLETYDSWGHARSAPKVKVYLDWQQKPVDEAWWLCLDGVAEHEIRRFLRSRRHWSMGVGHMRLFRRLADFLGAEAAVEAAAREYLLEQATTHGGLPEEVARPALDVAVRNWRAARRGEALPPLDNPSALNELLNLIAPAGYVSPAMAPLVDRFIDKMRAADEGHQPLLLTRSGTNRYVLYTTASDLDKAPYPAVLRWGWVRRVVVEPTKAARHLREVSSSLVWLLSQVPASEVELRRYDGLDQWLHKQPEPIKLRTYAALARNLADAAAWASTLRGGEGAGVPDEIFDKLAASCAAKHRSNEGSTMPMVRLAIPVAAYGKDRQLSAVYMLARAERVLYFYGSKDQRARLLDLLSRYYSRSGLLRVIDRAPQWEIAVSDEEFDRGPFQVSRSRLAGGKGTFELEWARHVVSKNAKRTRGKGGVPGVKGDGKPSLFHHAMVAELSLNRMFDELAGVGPFGRRRFYKAQNENIKWECRWLDVDKAAAKRKEIASRRYEHPAKAVLSPLIWSAAHRRSFAQAVFAAPVRAHKAQR
ncbi:hypothetical protein [Rubrivivax gelatinosus]|uniref:hypothetical protein n=1 Tax=Rubrivivax gelatinosus TaxID=28068 RepID=UPI0005C1CC9B|nr:hypothetical protein [Rubrivivax gelatinosus]MBG6083071.1 hypothetical protein [Rubrivivax gelatinosus]